MATQSTAPPGLPDEKSQNPGPELPKPVDGDAQNVNGETANGSSAKSPFANPELLREEQVQNAVKFLSHPKVRGSPVIYRRSFLEKKGLTKEEIDEAFHRVPDPPSNATSVEAAIANHAIQPTSSTGLQPQVPSQTAQPPTAPVSGISTVPTIQQTRFHWSHAVYAVGLLAASGAGTAFLVKNTVVPRLKAWIRKVVAEENDSEEKDKSRPNLAEEAAEAAKAAASAAAIVAKASQELLNAKNEERKYFETFKGMIDVQVEEMKSMGNAIRKLEITRENTHSQDKRIEEHVQSTPGNGTTNNSGRINQVDHSDASLPSMVSKQLKVNGTPDAEFGAARPSSAPASMEPITAPHPKSYMEIMAMVQRGEKPPGIKEINDMPPNPNQPQTKSLLAPRLKPWEVVQPAQQKPSFALQSQSSGEGLSSELQENGSSSQLNGKSLDSSEPWWRKKTVKITEIEPELEESRQTRYGIGVDERPIQRGWVPPQPPTVTIPEAAAAIRQPKSSVQKQQSGDEMVRRDEGAASASDSAVEVETSDSADMILGQSEIQEERPDGIEVN